MHRVHPKDNNALCPHSRCAQCVLVLAAQKEVEPPPRKPDIDEEIGYRLVQEAPAVREGMMARYYLQFFQKLGRGRSH